MSRFYGPVGFSVEEVETSPGIYNPPMTERNYFGSVIKHNRQWEPSDGVNDDLNVTNQISIVADDYSYKHCSGIRYVKWMDAYWKVTSFEISPPRILLNLGGVWNGDKA